MSNKDGMSAEIRKLIKENYESIGKTKIKIGYLDAIIDAMKAVNRTVADPALKGELMNELTLLSDKARSDE